MVELFPDTKRDCDVPRTDAPGHPPTPACDNTAKAETAAASLLKLWRPVFVRALALGFGALFLAGIGSASFREYGSQLSPASLSQLRAAAILDTGGSDWLKPGSDTPSLTYSSHTATGAVLNPNPSEDGDSNTATQAAADSSEAKGPAVVEKVILNEAGASELRRLPGVGARRAEQILALRAQFGRFRKLSDLLRVKGIGPKLFRRMLPMLSLDRPVNTSASNTSPPTQPPARSAKSSE